MADIVISQKSKSRYRDSAKSSSVNRAFSDRPKKKVDAEWMSRGGSRPIPQTLTYLLMKEKFEQIYKDIQRISLKDEQIVVKMDRRSTEPDPQVPSLSINSLQFDTKNPTPTPEASRTNAAQLQKKISMPEVSSVLEINTAGEEIKGRMKGSSLKEQLRKTRYRKKMLEPLNATKAKLSNNIKDYLSVEKISMREIQESMLANRARLQRHGNHNQSCETKDQPLHLSQSEVVIEPPKRKRVEHILMRRAGGKFKPPFPLYHYRDFIWKVAYSNQFMVEKVEEYDGKIKYFVGSGNNSNLIKGLMKRRPWFVLTDKVMDANFIWTQIKLPSIFQTQKKGQPPSLLQIDADHNKQVLLSILNANENQKWRQYWSKNMEKERIMKESMRMRSRLFGLSEHSVSQVKALRVHNHFCNNYLIGNKKALFQTMSDYYSQRDERVFDHLPLTFHIKNGLEDDEYLKFLQHYYSIARHNKVSSNSLNRHNAWIVKPGQNTNRGNGIIVCLELSEVKAILRKKEKHGDGTYKTYILQKYIEKPLLYRKRKFDLRHYLMISYINGCVKGYWYRHGYVRTTSAQYSLNGTAGAVHLTNDAVQKTLPDYGRFEKGNKITYQELDAYLKKSDSNFDFQNMIYPQMKATATNVIHASALSLDPQRRTNNFQIFGLDFMIDADYKVWLIQVNTNPCLQTTCPVLAKIIPAFVQHTFQICLDPLFPAPIGFQPSYQNYYGNLSEQNAFELVFDERIDRVEALGGQVLSSQPEEEEDVFDDDGENFED